jgi:hypothetical protein
MSEDYWLLIEPIWDSIKIDGVELFLRTYRAVTPGLALLYAAHFCQSEVCNGGFEQLFLNSTGVLAPEAVAGFRAIGQQGVADVVQTAMDELEVPYPRDRTLRTLQLADLTPKKFDALDSRFYALIGTEGGGLKSAADRYAAS